MVIDIFTLNPFDNTFDMLDILLLITMFAFKMTTTIRKHRDYYPNRSGTQVIDRLEPSKKIELKRKSSNPYRKTDKLLRRIGIEIEEH